MEFPFTVSNSRLFAKLTDDAELLASLRSLRAVVAALAETTARSVPDYTDHTIRHMDALWSVAEQILTPEEIDVLTPAEAFLLCCGFYLHDIGMAYAATNEGLQRLKESAPYKGFIASLPQGEIPTSLDEAQATAIAVRQLHANAAKELAEHEIPGSSGRYLFEALSVREGWGRTCGDIASSHHWDIARLESFFGAQGLAPLPGGRNGDLLYVAACLRLIDYAHINRERASSLDRAFRSPLNTSSLLHWLAQEHIDGPVRDRDELVYRAANPISDIDAWWLYYEMLKGLDAEIRSVRRMLGQRHDNQKRLTISGVRDVASPEEAARHIPPLGFLPIEVNLRTGSIDRLVELLAGETLYGPNPIAAVRELVQNARDAVLLKAEVAANEFDKVQLCLPITISLNTTGNTATLEVIDYGIGMTRKVMTDYLIAIASDYWTSQFANDFPAVAGKGFKHAGKFGIGFLSIFMLGEEVEVESNRAGEDRYRLSLRGVGRRGELRQIQSVSGSGTAIRVKLRQNALTKISPLDKLLPIYAPTIPHNLVVSTNSNRREFRLGWLMALPLDEFTDWVIDAASVLDARGQMQADYISRARFDSINQRLFGHSEREMAVWIKETPEFIAGNTRLVASFFSRSVLCLRGLAIQTIKTPGFMGVVEVDSVTLEVSRNRAVRPDVSSVINTACIAATPQVVNNLNAMSASDLIIDKTDFIAACVGTYGKDVLLNSCLPWVSQIMFPGNVELLNSATLVSKLAIAPSIFLSINTGPWTAMRKWVAIKAAPNEIGLLIDGERQASPRYTSDEEIGSIEYLWKDWSEANLFRIMIDLVAQAWQMSPDTLVRQDGWTLGSSTLWGRLQRHTT